jgi:Major Facilitator Superfamily
MKLHQSTTRHSDTDHALSLTSSLRLSLRDAACYSMMVGLGEAYLAAFVLALGFSAVSAGLITTVPVVVGASIQLSFLWIYNYISSYRDWVVKCAIAQALTLIGLASLPLWAPHHLHLIYIMAAIYWACSFSAGPAWNAWMGQLVPERLRVRFFTERTRRSQIFTFVGLCTAGFCLQIAEKNNLAVICFSALLFSAGLARLLSAYFVSQQNEVPKDNHLKIMSTNTRFLHRLKEPKVFAIFAYLFCLQLAVYTAAPYFSPYMLKNLNFSYLEYMILTSTTFLSRILFYPVIQKLVNRHGPLKMVWAGTLTLAFSPLLWTLSTNYFYIMSLQVLSGIGWGMQEIGVFLLLLDRFQTKERSSILSLSNFLNSLGMLLGSLLGSRIINLHGEATTTYFMLFTISTVGRFIATLAIPLLDDVPKERRFSLFWRIVGLRPNLGAIMRPILYIGRDKHDKPTKKHDN